MKDFFYAIQDLFVDYLFWPFDFLRELALDNWWLSNIVSWILTLICLVAFVYWMKQLKDYNDNNEEDKSVTAHDYL
ncbi:MAG TPA: hypothetical protein VKN14_02085 [Flavobacteriaceae bacterium]|nr:hypothetical protein [Flavobacteriaceae bacterium]